MKPNAKTEIQEQKKPKKSRIHWYSLLIFCFLLFAFSPFLLFQDVPLRISKETTYLTEPLTADGTQVDYQRVIEEQIYPPQMQTDDNGFRTLTLAIGLPKEISERNMQGWYYEKLGLSATHTPPLNYVNEYEFVRNYLATNPDVLEPWKEKYVEHRKSKDPTYSEDVSSVSETDLELFIVGEIKGRGFDPWKEWIAHVDPVLDTLAEAVRKPVFVAPGIPFDQETLSGLYYLIPEIELSRSLVRSLTQRALYRIDNGNIDRAIDDIITCYRLGRHFKNQCFTIHHLVGQAYEGAAVALGPNANPEVPMSAEQIRRLLREIDDFPASQPLEKIWDTERLLRLSILQKVPHLPKDQRKEFFAIFFPPPSASVAASSRNWWEELVEPRNYLHLFGYNWNTILKRFNEAFDEIAQGTWTAPTPSESYTVWWTQMGRSEEFAKAVAVFAHTTPGSADMERKNQFRYKIQKFVLTMLLYEKEHGTLPPTFTVDANETPLHSWRVLLLPYFGEEEKKLYEKIRLDEPWNSDWNKQFHETETLYGCPCPGAELKGRTDYTVFVGEETPFAEKPNFGRFSKDFGPYTILIAERKEPICWMDPTQEITQDDAEKYVGSTARIHFGFNSGAATTIPDSTELEHFRKLLRGTAESTR